MRMEFRTKDTHRESHSMKNFKIAVSIMLFAATIASGIILSASSGGKNTGHETELTVLIDEEPDCVISDDSLRFLSPAWRETHLGFIQEGRPEACDRKECYACHISAAPHDFPAHQSKYREDEQYCMNCHDYDSCNECHQAFWAHGSNTDFLKHDEFLEGRTSGSCKQCHSAEWCNECHAEKGTELLSNHNPNFREMHPIFLPKKNYKEKVDGCMECHGQKFCIICHEDRDVHPYKWYVGHGGRMAELAAGAEPGEMDRCLDCHKTGFCTECHQSSGLVRTAHEPGWVDDHQHDPQSKTPMCVSCHTPDYCSRCHEISLPHSTAFVADHKMATLEKPDTCKSCHQPAFCTTCHTDSLQPESHSPADWYKKHNKLAGKSEEYCTTCHSEKKYCGWCHEASTMDVTHTAGWEDKHSDTESLTELEGCAHCHTKTYCDEQCHSEIEQTASAADEPDHRVCSNCHVDDKWTFPGAVSCVECHEEVVHQNSESKHAGDCTDCHDAHKWTIPAKGNTCASAACHQSEAKEVAKIKDHVSDNCSACHKPHDWGDKSHFVICSDCHEIDEYDGIRELHLIGAHQMCGDCHDPHNGEVSDPDSCLRCHKQADLPRVCEPERLCSDCHDFK